MTDAALPEGLVERWAEEFWRTMSAGRTTATYPDWSDLDDEDREDVARGLRAVLAVAAPALREQALREARQQWLRHERCPVCDKLEVTLREAKLPELDWDL